ncbi:hypothetical protein PR048_011031 [Dryococelus australis]|uniref:Integrase catalytic domain-containing protein n=1 Tax=Dryococelus australis TaxID=614101 RepID=A0ABQ9HKE9_9NEOP|nr:hypothetical protein PR048_011031 [Dryococelus australis]
MKGGHHFKKVVVRSLLKRLRRKASIFVEISLTLNWDSNCTKEQSFGASENFMNCVRKLEAGGNRCLRIRIDCSDKYTSHQVKDDCKPKGIRLEYTLPYMEESNGVNERFNQTLLNKVSCMFG